MMIMINIIMMMMMHMMVMMINDKYYDGDHGDNDDLSFSSKEPLSKTERPSANSLKYHMVQLSLSY